MDFYQSLGNLILGTRLRRLSEYYLTEINKFYQLQGIEFDASWFPVFFLLDQQESLSIGELSRKLSVSHSATSQLISNLKKKGLIKSHADETDKRVQKVYLTENGLALLKKIKPIWALIHTTMGELEVEHPEVKELLTQIQRLEEAFEKKNLSQRLQENQSICTIL